VLDGDREELRFIRNELASLRQGAQQQQQQGAAEESKGYRYVTYRCNVNSVMICPRADFRCKLLIHHTAAVIQSTSWGD
jgi:hypothetical protein